MKKGKPDGYWKSYYENGQLKSEGNRKNYLLDSIWIFYNDKGDTTEKINYLYGVKNGYSYGYECKQKAGIRRCNVIYKELYVNDLRQSHSYYYYDNGKLHMEVMFRDNKKHGSAWEYDENGMLITLLEYRNDYVVSMEKINRKDERGFKQGSWKDFYPNGKIKIEANYLNDNLHGQYKAYDEKGKIIKNARYENGVLAEDNVHDIDKAVVKKKYYPSGKTKTSGSYRDTIPVGIHREYDENGKVTTAKVYDDFGILTGNGIVDNQGNYIGQWREYYPEGEIKAEGSFTNSKKTGEWVYYFKSGKTEQKGRYEKGKLEGTWRWYYENDSLKRVEEFYNGKEEGPFVEYDESGKIIAKGNYLDGEKDGPWYYNLGDHIQKGEYKDGLKEGIWKFYFPDGKLKFEGNFIQGNEDGKHHWYYDNGIIQEDQFWVMGSREKTWKSNDEFGNLIIAITYKNNKEIKINGLPLENEEKEVKKKD
ncbi:MAG: hypothetical protein NTW49_10025 [Bacteroidia bacterium]|nr:hypothetical protein [Bacteroidia bacterium]